MCCQNELEIIWSLSKDGAKVPKRAENSGGYDVYACFEEEEIIISPNKLAVITTGVHSHFNYDYVALAEERGSTGVICLARRAGVIDGNFTGEWKIMLNNTSDKTIVITKDTELWNGVDTDLFTIYPYSKAIAQVLFLKVPLPSKETVISYEEYQKIKTNRGDGMLGNSGH